MASADGAGGDVSPPAGSILRSRLDQRREVRRPSHIDMINWKYSHAVCVLGLSGKGEDWRKGVVGPPLSLLDGRDEGEEFSGSQSQDLFSAAQAITYPYYNLLRLLNH